MGLLIITDISASIHNFVMGNFSLQIPRRNAAVEINSYCSSIYCQIMTEFEASALNDVDFNVEGTNGFIFEYDHCPLREQLNLIQLMSLLNE